MTDFLTQMAERSEQRAADAKTRLQGSRFDESSGESPVPLKLHGFDIVAEIKERSPSEGALTGSGRSRAEQAALYVEGGAAAISVLTEPSRFAGTLAHLREVADIARPAGVPVMRKDFLVDPVQIAEARAAGASGVLLIAAMLSDAELHGMLDCAWDHSLFVLLESFDENDLQRTGQVLETERHARKAAENRLLAGVNTRNLRTLAVDRQRLAKLAPMLPARAVCVAESGLHAAEDAAGAVSLGYRMGLVGTALMRSAAPAQLLAEMLDAGRTA